jgi:GNAT superfamily N-acetyltransferase
MSRLQSTGEPTFRELGIKDFASVKQLQHTVILNMENPDWLRHNSSGMLLKALGDSNNWAGGYFDEAGDLIALGVLYDGTKDGEAYCEYDTNSTVPSNKCLNYKLVLVRPDHRGKGLQLKLQKKIEQAAIERGAERLYVTVHKDNQYSVKNINHAGYKFVGTVQTKYGQRTLFAKMLKGAKK